MTLSRCSSMWETTNVKNKVASNERDTEREKKETLKRIANSKSCLYAQRTTWSPTSTPDNTLPHSLSYLSTYTYRHTTRRRSTPFDFSLHSIPPHCTRPFRCAHSREHSLLSPSFILSSLFLSPFLWKKGEKRPVFTSFAHALSLPLCRSLSIYRTTSVVFGLFPAYPFDIWFIPSTAHRVLRVVRFDYHTMDCRPIVKRNALAVKHDEITFGQIK